MWVSIQAFISSAANPNSVSSMLPTCGFSFSVQIMAKDYIKGITVNCVLMIATIKCQTGAWINRGRVIMGTDLQLVTNSNETIRAARVGCESLNAKPNLAPFERQSQHQLTDGHCGSFLCRWNCGMASRKREMLVNVKNISPETPIWEMMDPSLDFNNIFDPSPSPAPLGFCVVTSIDPSGTKGLRWISVIWTSLDRLDSCSLRSNRRWLVFPRRLAYD